MLWEKGAVRVILVIIITAAAMYLHPFGLSETKSAVLGLGLGIFFIFFEIRLEKASLKRLMGAAFGSILGILGALMISHLLSLTMIDRAANSFFQVTLLLLMAYVGLVLGANKGDLLNLGAMGGFLPRKKRRARITKCSTPAALSTAASPTFVKRVSLTVRSSSLNLCCANYSWWLTPPIH